VIILSYAHSGATAVQQALADRADLACTMGTGILPLCEVAAASWARVEGRPEGPMSQLAVSSVRALVSVQISVLLAAAGSRRRWCELATSPPSATAVFLRILPAARVVCVYRDCVGMIAAAAEAQPWGLAGSVMAGFALDFPGNTVAAIAAYWASATERLLTFEAANPQASIRLRYEDAVQSAGHALTSVRSDLQLEPLAGQQLPPGRLMRAESGAEDQHAPHLVVPTEMIPAELRNRIGKLQAELGYPALPAVSVSG
jgi:Sulfotransferase family